MKQNRKLVDPATDDATYRSDVERMIDMFACYKPRSATIIRCAAAGACVGEFGQPYFWAPAYFTPEDQDKVVDVTGAGNAFLVRTSCERVRVCS
jgi:sugar/nucleoside kinase (ribokinase family)